MEKLLEGYGKNPCLKLCFKYLRMLFGNKRVLNLSSVATSHTFKKKPYTLKFHCVILIYMVLCFFPWHFVLLELLFSFINTVSKINKYQVSASRLVVAF